MKYPLLILALIGVAASSLALREHYRPYGESPCDINARWDCGIVNHSPYAMIPQRPTGGIPVAVIGIAGYLLLAILALIGAYRLMLVLAIPALGFSLYLANIEAHKLGVWCLYCAISLATISCLTVLLVAIVLARALGKKPS